MNNDILNLEPKSIWKNFSDLNSIPRPSKKEEKVREFIITFGKKLGLNVLTDNVGNVLIKKSAYPGMEDRKKVILQSHLDMVCQKNNEIDFDFYTQGIEMYIEEDKYVTAKGTTLGADNGIGVAAIMAILESKNIPHPEIEALFTIDEETGMTGAMGLKPGFLSGKILLNLDTEEDDELDIGCAGGIDITATKKYEKETITNAVSFIITVKGLSGGHSGIQIHEGLGNSNKLIARLLNIGTQFDIQISHLEGGGLRNAIPRESWAKVIIPNSKSEAFRIAFETLKAEIINEYSTKEPKLSITLEKTAVEDAMPKKDSEILIQTIMATFNGVYRISPDIEGLVETSNNISRIETINGNTRILCLTRSSVESNKEDLVQTLKSTFMLGGFDVEFSGSYPGWKANPNSEILEILKKVYIKQNNNEPKVTACHAGLECGIIGTNYPDLEMISFGPNISGAHSPDEKVEIVSVQKFWKYLLEILKVIPNDGYVDYSCLNSRNI